MPRQLWAALLDLPANLKRAIAALIVVPTVATLGYIALFGWTFIDALYMTVTVLTTIGFREVRDLDTEGRVYTIFVALSGVGTVFYALVSVMQFIIEGELGHILGVHRMKDRIDRLRDHYVLCGFGRVGEEIAREFMARDIPFVVVETTDEAIERARKRGVLLLIGDATSDEVLRDAGVERARGLLAASDSDAGNTFITLTAKSLNPNIYVIARASHLESQQRMQRAGADRVFSPYLIAGRQMAISALHPIVTEFIDSGWTGRKDEPVLAEIEVTPDSGLAGQTLDDVLRGRKSVIVLGLRRATGDVAVAVPRDTRLEARDRIIVLGREAELEAVQPNHRHLAAG